jgi:DNA polymerase III delta prime subunit
MKELWVEKYRPKTLKEYVVRDEAQRQQIQSWITDKAIPHLLLSGAPGVGKTTLAKVLFNELDVSSYDILEINASRENSVDTVREKINNFVQIMPFGDYKYVLLGRLHESKWTGGLAWCHGDVSHVSKIHIDLQLSQQSYPCTAQQMPRLPHGNNRQDRIHCKGL